MGAAGWWGAVAVVTAVAATLFPSVQTTVGPLQVELALTRPSPLYFTGEEVGFVLTARNVGQNPLSLQFRTSQRFDVVVRRRGGAPVWRWSHDRAFLQVLSETTLPPGMGVGPFRATWAQVDLQGRRVEAGEYEAVGLFLGRPGGEGRGAIETPPLPFRIQQER